MMLHRLSLTAVILTAGLAAPAAAQPLYLGTQAFDAVVVHL